MPPRADLLDQILGGMEDAAERLRSARRRVAWGVALQGVRLSRGIAQRRSRAEHGARRGIEQLRRRATRPLGRAAGALVGRLPVARRGDCLRLEGRVAILARELEALEAGRAQTLGGTGRAQTLG
jgi:hypothetical protein